MYIPLITAIYPSCGKIHVAIDLHFNTQCAHYKKPDYYNKRVICALL